MVLYADILFLINFSMDFLSLFICSLVTHRAFKKKRIIISSILGAIFGVFQVLISLSFLVTILLCIGFAYIMVRITFSEKAIKDGVILTSVYFFVSTALGGIMSVVYSLLNKILSRVITDFTYEGAYDGVRLVIIVILTLIVSLVFSKALNSKKDVRAVNIIIKLRDKSFELYGLCDTGNMLKEPFSGKSVILVTKGSKIGAEIASANEIGKKYIPYRDVHGEGLLRGIAPDEVKIEGKLKASYVAVCETVDFGGYDALVPGALL